MSPTKELKKQARQSLKKHYAIYLIICLIAVFLGTEFSGSLEFIKTYSTEINHITGFGSVTTSKGILDVAYALLDGKQEEAKKYSQEIRQESREKQEKQNAVFGRNKGIFADAINALTSGAFLVTLVSGLNSLFRSYNFTLAVMIFLCIVGFVLFWFFIVQTYAVIARRLFLEGRTYKRIEAGRFLYLLKSKKWANVSKILLRTYIYQWLWNLTIIGGFIKKYSYFLVPFIAAENPSIKGKEAILLSRKMMDGHKWQCFVLELSMLGWKFLDMLTVGLSAVIFTNLYQTAVFCEYYTELRRLAKLAVIPGSNLLDDYFLYKKADDLQLQGAYFEVASMLAQKDVFVDERQGISKFMADVFGITLWKSAAERKYERNQMRQLHLKSFRYAMEKEVYPTWLNDPAACKKYAKSQNLDYTRRYTVWSLVIIFFAFSFIGWLWEVCIHLNMDGMFVNRGVLHGPWLPIYGSGAVLILMVLNKMRKIPVLEFFMIVQLCGIVEYAASALLEQMHHGKKWWDYSGYFLNINGRICAEGLLAFGVGGMAIVYVLAPLFDNLIHKMRSKVLIVVCTVLLIVFCADLVYSFKYPNTGKGITDYGSSAQTQTSEIEVPMIEQRGRII